MVPLRTGHLGGWAGWSQKSARVDDGPAAYRPFGRVGGIGRADRRELTLVPLYTGHSGGWARWSRKSVRVDGGPAVHRPSRGVGGLVARIGGSHRWSHCAPAVRAGGWDGCNDRRESPVVPLRTGCFLVILALFANFQAKCGQNCSK